MLFKCDHVLHKSSTQSLRLYAQPLSSDFANDFAKGLLAKIKKNKFSKDKNPRLKIRVLTNNRMLAQRLNQEFKHNLLNSLVIVSQLEELSGIIEDTNIADECRRKHFIDCDTISETERCYYLESIVRETQRRLGNSTLGTVTYEIASSLGKFLD